jgi:polyribonucleotide nucleotidyltransferase
MQAGIPLKASVAGVAMGLVKEGDDYAILTDIAGAEDHYGDMDFKVAGTRDGITALQMDIKIGGITGKIMREALEQARHGRLFILDKMDAVLATPSESKSKFAPRIETLQIPVDKIRDLIGPGGKTIRGIIEATQVKIDVDDTGRVNVASSDEEGLAKALQMISDLTAVPEIGKTYLGKVVRLAEFGAFVEIFPGTDGLLHISEIAEHRVKEVKDELHEGDQVLVKVLAIEGNRIKLSRKAILKEQRAKLGLPAPEGSSEDENGGGESHGRSERSGERGGDRGGDRGPRRDRGDRGGERGGERGGDRGPRPPRAEQPAARSFDEQQPVSNASTITIESDGDVGDFTFDEEDEPNFNRADDAPAPAPGVGIAGAADANRRRRGRRRPGGGGGGSRGGNSGGRG